MSLSALLSRARPYAPLAVIAAAVATGFVRGLGVALLVLAGGMLVLAIALIWDSVQSLGEDTELTLDEALALAAPSAEEEQKRSVLRALKDLEYERGVGKVSDEDYLRLTAHYREEARRLLQLLDREQTPARDRAEKLVEKYLSEKVGATVDDADADDDADDSAASPSTPPSKDVAAADADDDSADDDSADDDSADDDSADDDSADDDASTCASCKTKNDTDARFCKSCGESLK